MQVETAPHSYLDGESPTADSPPHIDNSLSSYTFPQASRRTDARDESLSPDAFRDPLDEHYRRHESSYEITSDGGQSHLPSSHQQPRSMHNFDFEPSSPNREDDEELEEGRDSDDEGEPGETGEDQTEMSELGRTVVSGGPVQRVISTYPFAEYMGSEHQAEHRPGGPPAESSTPYPSQSSTLGFAPPYQPHHPGYPPYPGASYHHPHPHAHPHPHHAFASQSPSYYGRDDEMARQQASTPEGAASESSRSAILPGPRHPASYYTPYQPNSLPASRGAHPVHSDGHYHGRGPYGDPNAEAAYLQHYNASMSAMGGAPQGYAPYGYYASTGSRMAPDELHRMNNMLQREGPLSMHAPNGMPFAGMRSARPATTTRAPRKSASKSSKASTSSGKVRTRVPGTVFHPTPQSMLTEAARRGHISAGALSQRGREGAPPPFPGTSRPGIPTDAEFALMPTKRSRGRRPPISPELVLSEDPNANPSESQIAFCGVTKTGKPKKIFLCKVPSCGKCFKRSEHLKRHVRSIHTDEKPFQCKFNGCFRYFSRHDNLNQHLRVHRTPGQSDESFSEVLREVFREKSPRADAPEVHHHLEQHPMLEAQHHLNELRARHGEQTHEDSEMGADHDEHERVVYGYEEGEIERPIEF